MILSSNLRMRSNRPLICTKLAPNVHQNWRNFPHFATLFRYWWLYQVIRDCRFSDKPWTGYSYFTELVGEGLVSANGALWKRHRTLIQPCFHLGVLDGFLDVFAEEAAGLVARLSTSTNRDIQVDGEIEMTISWSSMRSLMSCSKEDGDASELQVSEL